MPSGVDVIDRTFGVSRGVGCNGRDAEVTSAEGMELLEAFDRGFGLVGGTGCIPRDTELSSVT